MLRLTCVLAIWVTAVGALTGCGTEYYPDALPADGDQIDAIVSNDSLDPQEKRDQLAAYGMDNVTINALLRDERLGNQYGGTLSTALEKVENDSFTTMTPDEVQYFGDATEVTTYSDTQAQAIVDFFSDYEINSAAELGDFLDDPATELPEDIDEDNIRGVFIDASLDAVRDKID